MAAVSIGLASSEKCLANANSLASQTGFGISEPQIHILPGVASCGQILLKIEGSSAERTVSTNLALCCQAERHLKSSATQAKSAVPRCPLEAVWSQSRLSDTAKLGIIVSSTSADLRRPVFLRSQPLGCSLPQTTAVRTEKRGGRFRLAYPSETAQACI